MSEHVFETADTDNGLAVYITDTMGITGAKPRAEIVRCRDCKNFETVDCAVYRALRADDRIAEKGMFNPDGFCAWAERREA